MTVTTNTMRFFTDTGVEVPAVTAEQMREGDRLASEATGPNLFQMMENAGRNLALLAIAHRRADWEWRQWRRRNLRRSPPGQSRYQRQTLPR